MTIVFVSLYPFAYIILSHQGDDSVGIICWTVVIIVFWTSLAARLNFLLLSWWYGPSCPVLFDGKVARARVEIFSDGVYAAAATGLMIELLSGLLHGHEGGEGEE